MKRLFNIVSLVLVGISLCTCEQPEKEIPIPKITISDSVNADYESVSLTCTVTGNVTADRVIIDYSKDNSLAGSQTLSVQKQGDRFSVTIPNLEIQTTYYYRYTIENSITKIVDEQIRQFKTLDYSAPSVKTVGAKEILGKSATLEGEVLYTCGKPVLEKGFYIGPDKNSMTAYPVQQEGFVFKATELAYGATYFFQAYAKTEVGIGKGDILDFATLSGKPELETTPATNITATSATLNGEIKSDGGSTITERGFCYSENEAPTVNSTKIKIEGTTGQITTNITDLTPAKTYYARIYAVNETGTHYGNEVSFTSGVIEVSSVSLNKTSLALTKGDSETLVAMVKPDNATDKTVTWSSSNSSIASVDQNGEVTAKAGGSATITAKAGEKTASCAVTVTVPVTSITLDNTSLAIEEGKTAKLTATVFPEDATDKTVTWTSSNTTVATVKDGNVTAVKEGTATITAKAGDKTATCSVNVSKKVVAVTSVTLNKSSLTLDKGSSETLVATVKPDDATNKTVTWSSSNTSVATVDQNGKVTAIDGGSATITAKSGEKYATCSVTVKVPVSSITLDNTTLALEEGKTATLTATVFPENASDKTVTWTSSNTSIATVSDGTVTAVKEGTATITAKAGEKTANCKVTVSKKVVAVTSVTLNKSSLTLNKGGSETLVATVKPDDATEKTVTWSSSNPDIASVDSNGLVIALSEGTAAITAKAGEKSASCAVTVNVPVTSITLDNTSLALEEGGTAKLTATISPDDATDKSVTWTSSNTAVATVSGGTVTAIKEGTATITAKAGDKTATCSVTVSKKVVAVTSVTLNKSSLTLKEEGSETLVATVKPDDATDKTVTWTSSKTSVATVDSNGKVTAVAEGTATITAKAGDKSATCSVTVNKATVAVTSVTLNKSSLTLTEGGSETLVATVKPDDATDKTVTWTSSKTSVATVDSNGKVTAVAEGTATITAKAGDKSATCSVTVNKATVEVTSVTLNKISLTLTKGGSETLVATVKPDDATDKTVTWTSSKTSVAAVDSNGKVTAVAEGTATITAKAGNKSATCTATVTDLPEGALSGLFTVSSDGKQVYIAKGNLTYYSNTKEWYFAEEQYMFDSDAIITFAWGSSGYNGTPPYSYAPYDSSYESSRVTSLSGTEYDWGQHCKIVNGGNEAGLWVTLSQEEWKYLLTERPNASSLRRFISINGKVGLMILPDNWVAPENINMSSSSFTVAQWKSIEQNGAVFLKEEPIVYNDGEGSFSGNNVYDTPYWTSSCAKIYSIYSTYRYPPQYFTFVSETDSNGYSTGTYAGRLFYDHLLFEHMKGNICCYVRLACYVNN